MRCSKCGEEIKNENLSAEFIKSDHTVIDLKATCSQCGHKQFIFVGCEDFLDDAE